MNDLQTIKLTFDSLIDDKGNKQDIQFKINEDCSLVEMVINEKSYHIDRQCLIQLGKSCIPITYQKKVEIE